MGNPYDGDFFARSRGRATPAALQVLSLVTRVIKPKSAVDVGCGTGGWLRCLVEIAQCEICGVDGDYVPSDLLEIPRDCFVARDLSQPLVLDRQFDLAISLEVAEHLPPHRAAEFVKDLSRLAPAVLFSAAVPHQGGVNHLNEQWQSFWIELFERQGFETWDIIRPALWHRDDVAFCYRQNTFLFVDPAVHGKWHEPQLGLVDVIHPELFRLAREDKAHTSLRQLVAQLPAAARRSVLYRLSRHRTAGPP